jgi:hypothetical protein
MDKSDLARREEEGQSEKSSKARKKDVYFGRFFVPTNSLFDSKSK